MEQKTYGLGSQQDGDHYLKMRLQPIDLAYRLGATPCFCKLAKYLTRNKGDKLVNLQKARHCVTLEMDLKDYVDSHYLSEKAAELYSTDKYLSIIQEFSDNLLIKEALIHMWLFKYEDTLKYVDEIISRYQDSL